MKNQKTLEAIKKAFKKADSAIIAAHVDPDGDTIGSALAMAMILKQLGIATTIYSQDGVPAIYKFLPLSDQVKTKIPYKVHFNLAVTLDASDLSRTGDKVKIKDLATTIVNIDHHPDNTLYGKVNFVGPYASTAEQVYELCRFLKIKINKEIAQCLYTAMITDTGNFRYENTAVATFLMAADLLKAGLNTHEITTHIYDTKSIPSLKISSRALSQMEFSADHKIGWATVTEQMMKEEQAKPEDLIGIVDQIRSISGLEVAILFRQERDHVKINFRSKYNVNVSTIAGFFGGGGHVKAAGAVVSGNIEDVKNRVLAEVLKHIQV